MVDGIIVMDIVTDKVPCTHLLITHFPLWFTINDNILLGSPTLIETHALDWIPVACCGWTEIRDPYQETTGRRRLQLRARCIYSGEQHWPFLFVHVVCQWPLVQHSPLYKALHRGERRQGQPSASMAHQSTGDDQLLIILAKYIDQLIFTSDKSCGQWKRVNRIGSPRWYDIVMTTQAEGGKRRKVAMQWQWTWCSR